MTRWKVIVMTSLLLCLISINCLAVGVTIHRDRFGVPHIYSGTLEGLYYGWGYATAQDRLFNLEMLRELTYGKTSEYFGEGYLPLDIYFRSQFPTPEELKTSFNQLDERSKTIITSYTRGINAWIDEVMKDQENKLPYEYHQLGFTPRYWTETDVAAANIATLAIFMDLTNEEVHPQIYAYFKQQFGDKADSYFDDIAWPNDPSAYTTVIKGDISSQVKTTPVTDEVSAVNKKGNAVAIGQPPFDKDQLIAKLLNAQGFNVPVKIKQGASEAASYAVVVSPEKSANGHALLMSGPQFDHFLPSTVYEVGLHGAGFDVTGSAILGGPYLVFGQTAKTAFTTTAGAGNIVDIFEEKINPDNCYQYFYKGQWQDMQVRKEKFLVKGQKEPKEMIVMRTVHGPVVATFDSDKDGKIDKAYAKQTSCFNGYLTCVPSFTDLALAQTPKQFISAVKQSELSFNLFYADNSGNIAYYHTGKYPIRAAGIDLRFPTPGTGEYEWQGFITSEEHPQIINPASGLIVNWNNKPDANFDNGDLHSIFTWGAWSENHRVNNLATRVQAKVPLDVKDLKDVIHEIADSNLEAIAVKDYLVQALNGVSDARLLKARDFLAGWDNLNQDKDKDGNYDSVGLTIFREWWPIVNEIAFADEFGPFWDNSYNCGGLVNNYGGYSFMVRTIKGNDAAVPLKNDFYNAKGWKNVFVESMQHALESLSHRYGTTDMSKWLTPVNMMAFSPTHLSGAPTSMGSVPAIPYMDRGTENRIVDLAWPVSKGENICPPGQSGFINKKGETSPHMLDQLDMYANWQYKPVLLKKADVLINSTSSEIIHYNPHNYAKDKDNVKK